MPSNDEGQGPGDCNDIYLAANEFLSLADDQLMLLLGPPVASGTETDTQTGAETETVAMITFVCICYDYICMCIIC